MCSLVNSLRYYIQCIYRIINYILNIMIIRLSVQVLDFIYDISVCKRNTKNRL